MCNLPGEACGRVFLNLDAIDIEHFLVNNPRVFADLVSRHRNVLELAGNNENDGEDEGQRYSISRMNLAMRINSDGILLSRLNNNDDNDDNDDGSDSSGYETINIPNVGVGMHFTANNILIDRLAGSNHQEDNEDDGENDTNMEVDNDNWQFPL